MAAHKLTNSQAAIAARRADRLADGDGLELRVRASGSAQWVLRYSLNGRRRELGFGGFPTTDLTMAREQSAAQRRLALAGKDPQTVRRAARLAEARAGKTFAKTTEEFIALHQVEWKHPRQAAHCRAQLARYAYPIIGQTPVAAIDTGLVLRVLEPIWKSRTGVAKALRGRIEQILAYAMHKGYRSAEQVNPAQWKQHLQFSLPKPERFRPVRHHRSLPPQQIGQFVLALRRRAGVSARALEFLILTGARTTEVSQMEWSEVDEKHAIWTLPARVKGRREGDGKPDHQIPLAGQCMRILAAIKQTENFNGRFVFPGDRRGPGDRLGRSISDWALLQQIKRMGYHQMTVTHGMRSMLNSWALDQGVPSEPRRMMLSHVVGDAVEEAYRATAMVERRRRYNQQWADFVDQEVARAAQREVNEAGLAAE
ncbi:MAG TPA: integrase arm-type DNA-binding domain-containing protein [Stellaceae bacterium]|jgi:integrase